MYKWQQVKTLRAKGVSIKKIARKLKISKNTVRKYLRSSEPPLFKARQYERLLDQYKETIEGMIEKHYIGTRIYNELLQIGYKGSLSSIHRYIAGIKEAEEIKGLATTRVETEPGKQMQYDWKEWHLPVDGKVVKIYIHEVVLSYSRKKYYVSSLSITTEDVIRAIYRAIEFFRGLTEELVIDNPKQMVIIHKNNGTMRYNDEFLRFCGLYGIQPNPCRNYRARTKGKAERPFYYLQEHLLRGLEVNDLSEFDRLLAEFTDKYNARLHSDLKESPDIMFQKEKEKLNRIPLVEPAILYNRQIRKVSNDGYIRWDGALYPVAMRQCLQEVRIEAEFGKIIKVYGNGGELIAEHNARLFDKGIRPVHPEHEDINNEYMRKKEVHRAEAVRKFIEAFEQTGQAYVEGLKTAVTSNMYWHIEEIMKYTSVYSIADVSAVLAECIEIGAYHKNSVRRLLECRKPRKQPLDILNEAYIPVSVDIRRPLSDYRVEATL
jgi:transposase